MSLPNNAISKPPLKPSNSKPTLFVPLMMWVLFVGSVSYLILSFFADLNWEWLNILRFNSFTALIWTTVTFFSAIVSSYSRNYLTGFKFRSKFMMLCLGFTISVMLLVVSNSIVLFIISWLLMGIFMSHLIGIDKDWGEAREALKFTRNYFLLGTCFLTVGILLISVYSDTYSIEGLSRSVFDAPYYITFPSAILIIAAAILQSAIYPFHRWLLSAMTSPTPASALMHAGFVNGGGILLTFFAVLLIESNTMTILFIIGGITAVIAQFTKLLQVNVKQKLGCSTIAQMGFMIMQCGLGFFNAAVVHLILHGFYKAYLFLSSGEEIKQTRPKTSNKIKIKPLQAFVVSIFGILGAYLFILWTGKSISADSGIFLTLIVAITVGQATYNIIKEQSLNSIQKILIPPVLFIAGIGVYALFYNGVTALMSDLPMIKNPNQLSWTQIIFGMIFLLGFFIMKLGVYKKIPWLYVKLMNLSQPHYKTVLSYKLKSK